MYRTYKNALYEEREKMGVRGYKWQGEYSREYCTNLEINGSPEVPPVGERGVKDRIKEDYAILERKAMLPSAYTSYLCCHLKTTSRRHWMRLKYDRCCPT